MKKLAQGFNAAARIRTRVLVVESPKLYPLATALYMYCGRRVMMTVVRIRTLKAVFRLPVIWRISKPLELELEKGAKNVDMQTCLIIVNLHIQIFW